MFITALFIITQTWKQPWYPSEGGQIHKLQEIQSMTSGQYYSVLQRNKPSSYEKAWRNITCVLLSEKGQPEKATCSMISTIWHSGKVKTMNTVEKISGSMGDGGASNKYSGHRSF